MTTELLNAQNYGYLFIPETKLPKGKDEYWIRNLQAVTVIEEMTRRNLNDAEITVLKQNGCRSGNWNDVLVTDPFDPSLIWNSAFYGLVRLGKVQNKLLKHHDFCVPAGIRNSTIISCDIADDVSIQDCSHISHYIIGENCILSRVDELVTTNHAKFGNGIIKEGEEEDVRIWIDVMNEAGGRSILPFVKMMPADAYLWAAWRDDSALAEKLKEITQKTQSFLYCGEENVESAKAGIPSNQRGFYGTIGKRTVIKSCRIIKDTMIGEAAYIKGANKLKNLTILSCEDETSQIGEGVELVNGIAGYGCHIFYGAKAVRFVLGSRCSLKYGARLIHSVLGDNSTVSCCEILNNLVFPVHEQHHNNSFLIASLIEGMSNMAAGANVGSNHNSRSNDGEIRAGRGFWPGLSVTLKHNCRFASFCLIAKGNYPYELNIPLPFSLINNNVRRDRLEVMPAYFWIYNLYALERNSWKTVNRDRRLHKEQRIEAEYLAPDTTEEIINAIELLERWMAASGIKEAANLNAENSPEVYSTEPENSIINNNSHGFPLDDPEYELSSANETDILSVSGLERHSRKTVILKPRQALKAYRDMLFFYGMKTMLNYLEKHNKTVPENDMVKPRIKEWVNLGGQIVPAFRLDTLRDGIREGKIKTWEAIHAEYDTMANVYDNDRACHAWAVLAYVSGTADHTESSTHPLGTPEAFKTALEKTLQISNWITEQVYISRAKDFNDPFRSITYRNKAEMDNVAGKIENNSFIELAKENNRRFTERAEHLREKITALL